MRTVQIATLKNNLSAYLRDVRAGQEVVICDRNSPIAKIVPLPVDDRNEDERSSVAAGLLRLPSKPFDAKAFFAIGKGIRTGLKTRKALEQAVRAEREEEDVRLLGHKRSNPPVRSRSTK